MQLDEFYRRCKPFDLICFRTRTKASHFIELSQSLFFGETLGNHMGIVINKQVMPTLQVDDDDFYFWEATFPSHKGEPVDIERKKPISGVQIRRLVDVINFHLNSGHIVGYVHLKKDPFKRLSLREIQERMDELHFTYCKRKYQQNPINFAATLLFCCIPIKHTIGSPQGVFCSQFVATVYARLKLLKCDDPELFSPQELLQDRELLDHLRVLINPLKE